MAHPTTTIRRARQALHLLVSGALRDLESWASTDPTSTTPDQIEFTIALFDALAAGLARWEILNTHAAKQEDMLQEMQGDPAYRGILERHQLLPGKPGTQVSESIENYS